jgi:branched-chain amino acid transport system ATP-binding protein
MGGFLNKKPSLDYDLVFNYFPFLKDRLKQNGGTLSGGQQEMLSIARALIGEPKLLILDEPSEGIQPNIVQEISEFLLDLNANHNITVLFVEQNIDFVKNVANRGYVMNKGAITNVLDKKQLFNEEFLASQITI